MVDEPDLIVFFGVAPEEQPEEEREFSQAPLFVRTFGELVFSFSASPVFRDVRLDVQQRGHSERLLELHWPHVHTGRIEERGELKVLRYISETHGALEICVEPSLQVRTDLGELV